MQPYCFYNNGKEYDLLAIKANMGVGKTTNLPLLINQFKKVVILSFRISLDQQYVNNFEGFTLYSDIPGYEYDTNIFNKIVIQVDSFNKIRGNIDLLILDEITYTMSQLVYSRKKNENYEAVKQYLSINNTKVILLDALLENDILEYMSIFNKNILYIENTYKKHSDKKIINYENDYGLFYDNIMHDILHNKKIVIATNCKKDLDFLRFRITNKFKNKKQWLFLDCDSDDKLNMEKWKDLDILGYTPTISAGISFVEKHYDKIYGYFVNGSASAEIAVQQLFRVRNINDNEIHICVDKTKNDKYPTNDIDLDKYILSRNNCLNKTVDFVKIDHIKNDIIKDCYYYWYKSVLKREYLSYNNYTERIIKLLKSQGIINITNTGKKNILNDNEKRKIRSEHKKEMKEEYYKEIYLSPILTTEEYENKRNNINNTRIEKLSQKRYKFKNNTKIKEEDLSPGILSKFINHISKLNNLAYLSYAGKNIGDILSKRINYNINKYNNENTIYKLHASKRFEKMVWCLDLLRLYGFDINYILSYNKDCIKSIDKSTIKDYILSNYKYIDNSFGTIHKDWKLILAEDNWFTVIHRYINSKLYSMFKITIKRNKINKLDKEEVYIKGLEFWDTITYNNEILINEIKEKEENMYIQENCIDDNGSINIDAILELLCKQFNNKCNSCNNETINNNDKCLNCKFKKN